MKSFRQSLIMITFLIFVSGCNQQNNEFFVFADDENMNEELRQSLIQCLNTEEIQYKVDSQQNVLIKQKDSNLAVTRCS